MIQVLPYLLFTLLYQSAKYLYHSINEIASFVWIIAGTLWAYRPTKRAAEDERIAYRNGRSALKWGISYRIYKILSSSRAAGNIYIYTYIKRERERESETPEYFSIQRNPHISKFCFRQSTKSDIYQQKVVILRYRKGEESERSNFFFKQ